MPALCGECRSNKTVDEVGQQMALAAAMLTLQMNADLKRPDGKKYGVIGGENPDGINHPAAQIAASAVLMATVAAQSATFKKALMEAIKKKTPLFIKTLGDLSEEAAEALAREHGAAIADALNKVGGIGPYKLWRKFTAGLGGRWQAHHLLEEQMFKKWKQLGDPDLGPSVILTEAEHKVITARLRARTKGAETLEQLWEGYKDVYNKNPEYLEAIRSYFEKAK
jgi:hypothetical protein